VSDQDDAYFETDSAEHKSAPLVSCWITLDDATVDSSCMWVLPGGHISGVREHVAANGLHLEDIDETQAQPIELKAGHAMLHHGAMPHRTLANTSANPRRAVAIHYVHANATTRNAFRQSEPPENFPRVRSGGSGSKM
jgi:phytanoyl-CoA hydroxylase